MDKNLKITRIINLTSYFAERTHTATQYHSILPIHYSKLKF